MALPSVTYTLSNGTTADATQLNQNFTDLINGMTDGTKSFSIDALTVAGALSANGNVTLGNATGDDLSITARLASAIIPKTTNLYDLGTSSLGYKDGYFDGKVYCDEITEFTSTAGVIIKGKTNGSIGTGYVGENPGATAVPGTNGNGYSIYTTTALTNSAQAIVSVSLNKGVYIAGFAIKSAHGSGSNKDMLAYLAIGGVQVSQGFPVVTIPSGSTATISNGPIPIIVTADSVTVAVYAQYSAAVSSVTNSANELWVTRIA